MAILDPASRFFTTGNADKIVYTPDPDRLDLGADATVVRADGLPEMLADLDARGVRRLMVEGGSAVLAAFLTAGLADELHLAVAPRLVGDPRAPRFTGAGDTRLRLAETIRLGDVVVMRYLLPGADRHWLREAIREAGRCPPSPLAFSVGAVIVDATGREITRGYSRERDPFDHAEESALAKVDPDDPRLAGATIYSSLEPCSLRKSRRTACASLIRAVAIPRVVYAWREPVLFVDGAGHEELAAAGVEVIQLAELAPAAREVNAHPSRSP